MPLNYARLMSMKFEPSRQTYARKDTILYALGVGVGVNDPCEPGELKYVTVTWILFDGLVLFGSADGVIECG